MENQNILDKPKPWDIDTCFYVIKVLYDMHGSIVLTYSWLKDNNHSYTYKRISRLGYNMEKFCNKYDLTTERESAKKHIKNYKYINTTDESNENIYFHTKFKEKEVFLQEFLNFDNTNLDDLSILDKCEKESQNEINNLEKNILKNTLFGIIMKKRYPNAVWYKDQNNSIDYTKTLIPEYPAYYSTIKGEIYTLKYNRLLKDKDTGLFNKNGKNRRPAYQYICQAFYGNKPTEKHTVDHINRNNNDNRPFNLRWATSKEQGINRDNTNYGKGAQRKVIRTNIQSQEETIFDSVILSIFGIEHKIGTDISAAKYISKSIKKQEYEHWGFNFKWWVPENLGNILPVAIDDNFTKDNWYVSDNGWVKTSKNIYSRGTLNNEGYTVIKAGNKQFKVHQLIFKTFKSELYKPYPLYVINHKNGIKNDNRLDNLECITVKENTMHAYESGLYKNSKKIIQMSKNGEIISTFDSAALAGKAVSKSKSSCSRISQCCRGQIKTAYGFFWKYII